jgi:hypothetical protein
MRRSTRKRSVVVKIEQEEQAGKIEKGVEQADSAIKIEKTGTGNKVERVKKEDAAVKFEKVSIDEESQDSESEPDFALPEISDAGACIYH